MSTECNQFVFGFHPLKRREIRAEFNGGAISSDGGGLLLREVEKRIGILRQFTACFYRLSELGSSETPLTSVRLIAGGPVR